MTGEEMSEVTEVTLEASTSKNFSKDLLGNLNRHVFSVINEEFHIILPNI